MNPSTLILVLLARRNGRQQKTRAFGKGSGAGDLADRRPAEA
jgi:hypothetical protein